MSATWNVEGIIPKDDRWKRMADAWDACKMACVPIPKEVLAYFGEASPDDDERIINLRQSGDDGSSFHRQAPGAATIDRDRNSVEIDLSKLPPDVKRIRVYQT